MTEAQAYDVALSFAGEDRSQAQALAKRLRDKGVSVFYDQFERDKLWGKDLFQHLAEVYGGQARYCVVFVSEHYVLKNWTKHELKQAQALSFNLDREYILPLRIDDAVLPGLPATVGYIDLRTTPIAEVTTFILRKLGRSGAPLRQGGGSARKAKPVQLDVTPEEIRAGVRIGVLLASLQIVWGYDDAEAHPAGFEAREIGKQKLLEMLKIEGIADHIDPDLKDIASVSNGILLAISLKNLKKHAVVQTTIASQRIQFARGLPADDQRRVMGFALESIMDIDPAIIADRDELFRSLCSLDSFSEVDVRQFLNARAGR